MAFDRVQENTILLHKEPGKLLIFVTRDQIIVLGKTITIVKTHVRMVDDCRLPKNYPGYECTIKTK